MEEVQQKYYILLKINTPLSSQIDVFRIPVIDNKCIQNYLYFSQENSSVQLLAKLKSKSIL